MQAVVCKAQLLPDGGDVLDMPDGASGASMATPETLISAIQRREQRLRASWQGDAADTELLRTGFRRYRAFFDQLTKV